MPAHSATRATTGATTCFDMCSPNIKTTESTNAQPARATSADPIISSTTGNMSTMKAHTSAARASP